MQTVKEIEDALGWTEEDAANCGCNSSPNGPCSNCWSLGWQIGGIEIATGAGLDLIAGLPERVRNGTI